MTKLNKIRFGREDNVSRAEQIREQKKVGCSVKKYEAVWERRASS